MALIDGDNFVTGSILSYQEANRIKNNWRQSDPLAGVTNAQPGMVVSDEDDDKLHHITGASPGHDEILQATGSSDTTPQFNNLILDVDESDVSSPPADAELDAVFPTHPNGFIGFVQDTTSAGSLWLVVYYDGWWYAEMALAV